MKRRIAVAAAVLAVLVATILIALPGIARRLVVWQLSAATGRVVTLDTVDVELLKGRIGLRGLRVIDRDGETLITVQGIEVQLERRGLLGGRLHVADGSVRAMTLRIVRTGPERFNVSDLLAGRPEASGALPAISIDRFVLAGGTVVIEDRTLTPTRAWRVEALELSAQNVSTVAGAPPGDATLNALVAGSPVTLSVTGLGLVPLRFHAFVNAHEIDATLATLSLPPDSRLSPGRGKISLSATVDHDAATGTLAALDAGFAGVELYRPGQDRPYLSAPQVRVTVAGLHVRPDRLDLARVAVDGGTVVLEDTRLAPVRRWPIDGVALEARNLSSARDAPPGIVTARAATTGARVEVWGAEVRVAPLELQATAIVRNVDLAVFQLVLPPALPLQPERGVVNASIRIEYDERHGARLGVDAALGNIELRRPTQFVTAPSMRVTADGIVLDGDAIAVSRVGVTGNRLTLEERTVTPVRKWVVQDLAAEAKDLSSRPAAVQGVASLRATVAGSSVTVFVTGARLDPLELQATAVLRNVDAALIELYVPADSPVRLTRGVVNATIQVAHATADGTRLTGDATLTGVEAQGRGSLGALAVTASSLRVTVAEGWQRGEDVSVGRVELSGAGVLTDARGPSARFDFAQMRIASEGLTWPVRTPARVEISLRFRDRGELSGSGTARLTAPLPTIAWAAELDLQFRGVDLTPLAVYVPAAAGLGGRVRAKVTASLDYAGALTARVRGDVGGARFALVESGRTLLSLRSVNATGLDVQWPERMTIQQLRLRQPFGLLIRDRQGTFPLATRLAVPVPSVAASSPDASSSPLGTGPTSSSGPAPVPKIEVAELVVENGSAAFLDETNTPPVRIDMPQVNLTARKVTWPAVAPVDLVLEGTFPEGGTVKAEGAATLEPPGVDVRVAFQEAALAALQRYMPFRARIGGRLDATLTVAGPLTPVPRLKIRGDVGLRSLDISDGQRSVITADGLRMTGIDADWPDRLAFDTIRVRRSWALIERDRQGGFLPKQLLERQADASPPSPAPAMAASPPFQVSFREGVFSGQSATIVDGITSPPARIEVADARLTVHDFSWPARGPMTVALTSPMPAGGRVDVSGTVHLEPLHLEVRAALDGVALEPAQPYLPIEGRVAGKMSGDLAVKLALEPVAVQVTGQARLQTFRLNDGDRAVMTVGRVDTVGIDVDWPKRIAIQSVQFRRPRLLIERDASGQIALRRLVTPHWASPSPTGSPTAAVPQPPVIEIATLGLDRGSARFVDHTLTPAYAEELEDLTITFTPLTTLPGGRTRFLANGVLGGGSFKLQGEGAYGDRPVLDVRLDLQDFVVPRANPYLEHYTGWIATNGSLKLTSVGTLDGTRLDTRHDVVVRDLAVAPADGRDEVEQRIGLPFGLLVSLLKDARGEIRLSLPVSGDLGTQEFEYSEAVWSAVRNLSIRLLAVPLSKVGSLFFSQDSRVKAVALAPVDFEAGTARLGAGMEPHLERVASFLRQAPSMRVLLEPVLIDADVQALKRDQVLEHLAAPAGSPGGEDTLERARREYRGRWPDRPVPATLDEIVNELATAETLAPDALRGLGTRRLEVVRQGLARGGGLDVARLGGTARRTPLVESAGRGRVEFDLRP